MVLYVFFFIKMMNLGTQRWMFAGVLVKMEWIYNVLLKTIHKFYIRFSMTTICYYCFWLFWAWFFLFQLPKVKRKVLMKYVWFCSQLFCCCSFGYWLHKGELLCHFYLCDTFHSDLPFFSVLLGKLANTELKNWIKLYEVIIS